MIKVAIIGIGKMGISHLSILGAHPGVQVVGVCDTSTLMLNALKKYSSFACYTNYLEMLEEARPEAVFVTVPTKFHYDIIKVLLQRGLHVFTEKPLCLTLNQGSELLKLISARKSVNQVGYHNKFVGTFQEVKRLVKQGHLGSVHHFTGEAYGPVVVKRKQDTWRSNPLEGGGCLMDYASHVLDLINDILSPVVAANGSIIKSVYSDKVDDAVYSLLKLSDHTTGLISVNWSDDTYRKMSTSITIIGSKGKIISDANELKVFFKDKDCPPGYSKGWNLKHVTDFVGQVDFYLRGEEYSAQVDYFIKAVAGEVPNVVNTFQSAWLTDRAISIIRNSSKKINDGKNPVW